MQIMFNDAPICCPEGETLSDLLTRLEALKPGSALAVNQLIVPREQWAQHIVQDGDRILLFQAIAGG
ncbi:sulfur carrier protein ThiS [Entomohabitans teleogrylli]|uniref:sulfur carrier protein ThiS n=1 Tax=Entomohabitans teleogrylli TaxID=1384589 RepID=UPI00073D547D|nr:sulfur carrier protein ThiS [Entomohabitans teleogrylli]